MKTALKLLAGLFVGLVIAPLTLVGSPTTNTVAVDTAVLDLENGSVTSLEAPELTSTQGWRSSTTLKTPAFDLTLQNLPVLDGLVVQKTDSKGVWCTISRGDLTLSGYFDAELCVSGKTDLGATRIPLRKIKKVTVTRGAPARNNSSDTSAAVMLCGLADGTEMRLAMDRWQQPLAGQIGEVTASIDLSKIQTLRQTNGLWTLVAADNVSVSGWKPAAETFSGKLQLGQVAVKLSQVVSLALEKSGAGGHETNFIADWQMQFDDQPPVLVGKLTPRTSGNSWMTRGSKNGNQDNQIPLLNGVLQVLELNWDNIRSITQVSNGLDLVVASGQKYTYTGGLLGNTSFGSVAVASDHIKLIQRTSPASQRPLAVAPDAGWVTGVNDSKYPVTKISFDGASKAESDSDYFGYNLERYQAGAIELWIDSRMLQRQRIVFGSAGCVADELVQRGIATPLTGIRNVVFENSFGKFSCAIGSLKEYVPANESVSRAAPAQISDFTSQPIRITKKNVPVIVPAKFNLVVRYPGRDDFKMKAQSVEFIRYPAKGWSGSYYKSSYPFQWHRDSKLFFNTTEAEARLEVEFNKLSQIQITGDYTLGKRTAVLKSSKGTVMNGEIYPGDVTTSYPGISDWSPDKEGLICKLEDDFWIYVPFRRGVTVDLDLIQGSSN